MPDTDPLSPAGLLPAAEPVREPEAAMMRARVMMRLLGEDEGPTKIGRFMLLERVAEGGMGVVFAAYDPELDRKVAVKLLRNDKADESVRVRIVREAQAMAKLSHPNVAQVFEVGEHKGGMFIAMEFVRGETLRAWQKQEARSWRATLDVYLQAGRGLAAAHEVGLVHRDFKPDNAIVGRDGRVRVLDFGLARTGNIATIRELETQTVLPSPREDALRTPLTHAGSIMGTPAYMAAEQFLGEEVTAKADQFAFCVSLWEALFGERPFVGTTRADLVANVTRGRMKPPPKDTRVPGWMIAVIVRGLDAAPTHRFATITALLEALVDDPSRKRRRRLALGAVVLAAGGVAGGLALDHAARVRGCRDDAASIASVWNDDARTQVRDRILETRTANAAATVERVLPNLDRYATEWSTVREQSCIAARVEKTRPESLIAPATACLDERREALRALVQRMTSGASGETMVRWAANGSLGLPRLEACADDADLARWSTPPADPEVAAQILDLRDRLAQISVLKLSGAYDEALAAAEAVRAEAESIDWPPLHAEASLRVGVLRRILHDDKAQVDLEQALDLALSSGHDPITIDILAELVAATNVEAQYERSKWWGALASSLAERMGSEDSTAMATVLTVLGSTHGALGDFDEAVRLHTRAAAIFEARLGPEHPNLAKTLNNLGSATDQRGDHEQALTHFERSLAIMEAALGPNHPDLAASLAALGHFHGKLRAHKAAQSYLERALAIDEESFGPDHPRVANLLSGLAAVHGSSGHFDEALPLLRRAITIQERALGPDHPDLAGSLGNLASVLHSKGQYAESVALHERSLAIRIAKLGPEHPKVTLTMGNLANAHRRSGFPDRAIEINLRALAITEKTQPDDARIGHLSRNLGNAYDDLGRDADALAQYKRALAVFERKLGKDHSEVADVLSHLGDAQLRTEALGDARGSFERSIEICTKAECTASILARARFGLARAEWETVGDRGRAIEHAREAREDARTIADNEGAASVASIDAWLVAHAK